ncbi:hypothetical protein ABIE67_009976 [Streptomyces sp. V4I8]
MGGRLRRRFIADGIHGDLCRPGGLGWARVTQSEQPRRGFIGVPSPVPHTFRDRPGRGGLRGAAPRLLTAGVMIAAKARPPALAARGLECCLEDRLDGLTTAPGPLGRRLRHVSSFIADHGLAYNRDNRDESGRGEHTCRPQRAVPKFKACDSGKKGTGSGVEDAQEAATAVHGRTPSLRRNSPCPTTHERWGCGRFPTLAGGCGQFAAKAEPGRANRPSRPRGTTCRAERARRLVGRRRTWR